MKTQPVSGKRRFHEFPAAGKRGHEYGYCGKPGAAVYIQRAYRSGYKFSLAGGIAAFYFAYIPSFDGRGFKRAFERFTFYGRGRPLFFDGNFFSRYFHAHRAAALDGQLKSELLRAYAAESFFVYDRGASCRRERYGEKIRFDRRKPFEPVKNNQFVGVFDVFVEIAASEKIFNAVVVIDEVIF
ncbi:MAG: hypothetical protein BWY32_03374 [bacterium ADurb.Bin243]|nr:MAG: hypothetical protein BWY32_03374 [bacterium ADurb.Bin243]